jgi:hypothetical protein
MNSLRRIEPLVLLTAVLILATARQAPAWECTNPTEANMSASPGAVCYGAGKTHTITVNARDLDGMKKIEIILGGQVLKTCPYDPPTTEWKTCTTTWSSVGKDPGTYSFLGAVYDRCGDAYDWGGSANVHIMGGPITANGPCDKRVVVYNPYDDALAVKDTYSGVACGASYAWTIDQGGDKAEITAGANTIACTVRAKAASAAVDDVRLKLTYTKSGVSCRKYLYTTVQKPTSIIRQDLGYSVQTCNPVGEMRRWFRDTVYDQLGSTVANARWAESWTGGCNLQQGNSATGCNGVMIGDDEWSR